MMKTVLLATLTCLLAADSAVASDYGVDVVRLFLRFVFSSRDEAQYVGPQQTFFSIR